MAIAATNIVYMGESAVIMEQSIGVMLLIPIRNVICVKKNPNSDAAKMRKKSAGATFSRGSISDTSQKSVPAPIERNEKSASGDIMAGAIISFVTIMLSPKITYAVKQARCPFMLSKENPIF